MCGCVCVGGCGCGCVTVWGYVCVCVCVCVCVWVLIFIYNSSVFITISFSLSFYLSIYVSIFSFSFLLEDRSSMWHEAIFTKETYQNELRWVVTTTKTAKDECVYFYDFFWDFTQTQQLLQQSFKLLWGAKILLFLLRCENLSCGHWVYLTNKK